METKKNKLFLIAATLLFFSVPTLAQQYDTVPHTVDVPQYYIPNPLDSMHFVGNGYLLFRYPTMFPIHDWWETPLNRELDGGVNCDTMDFAFGFYSDTTLRLIGVAWGDKYGYEPFPYFRNSITRWDSVEASIYVPEGENILLHALKTNNSDNVEVNRIYMPWRGWGQQDNDYMLRMNYPFLYNFPIREIYFDREYDLTDSFYISVKYWISHDGIGNVGRADLSTLWVEQFSNIHRSSDTTRRFPVQPYIYKRDTASSWEYGQMHSYPLVFPIVRRDCDTCPEIQGLRWSRLGSGTTAFVQWDAGTNHRDWQLSYGPTGTPAGEGTVVDCPIAQSVLSGMAAGHPYDIYVRARCRFARDEWSAWSGPLEVGFGNPGEGIEGAATDIAAELTPNPATGRVRVSCGEALRMVEVYDMQGRRCLAQEVQGTETELDISALAAGRYTVLLHTATATAARPLIVQ